MEKKSVSKLFELFIIFFKIGAFTFGGGYAMVPIIQEEICKKKNWSSEEEFLDIIAIAQSLPGVLAVNTASIIGYKLFGIPGVIVASLGAVLPSFITILVIAAFFTEFAKYPVTEKIFKGIRPAVVALMAYSVIKLGKKVGISKFNLAVGIVAIVLFLLKAHPIVIILISGLVGIAVEIIGGIRNARANS